MLDRDAGLRVAALVVPVERAQLVGDPEPRGDIGRGRVRAGEQVSRRVARERALGVGVPADLLRGGDGVVGVHGGQPTGQKG